MSMIGTGRTLLGPWAGYLEKVKGVEPSSLIGLWLQNEQSGAISYDLSGQGNDGSYTGVTLGQDGVPGMGYTSPLYDGTNDSLDVKSAGLIADWDGAEGTFAAWAYPHASAHNDSTTRRLLYIFVNGSNYVIIARTGTNANIQFDYAGGGVLEQGGYSAASDPATFCHIAMTWSDTNDVVAYYVDGAAAATPDIGIGTWSGNPTSMMIGATSTVPANPYYGHLACATLWKTPLTAAQIAYLSKV